MSVFNTEPTGFMLGFITVCFFSVGCEFKVNFCILLSRVSDLKAIKITKMMMAVGFTTLFGILGIPSDFL